ncbi:hypothetical protein J2794_006315 [Paraburkholderia terricola]|jgi:hypothetical protein|nr:hypothetical protein [Paraburkholderia terricola]
MTMIERFRIIHLPILRDHLGNVTKPASKVMLAEYFSEEGRHA